MPNWHELPIDVRARAVRPREALYTGTGACARALGVHLRTVQGWLLTGELRGVRWNTRHYTDTKPRKTNRGRWLVEVSSIVELLTRLYEGADVPPAVRRRLKSLGKPLPGESP